VGCSGDRESERLLGPGDRGVEIADEEADVIEVAEHRAQG